MLDLKVEQIFYFLYTYSYQGDVSVKIFMFLYFGCEYVLHMVSFLKTKLWIGILMYSYVPCNL